MSEEDLKKTDAALRSRWRLRFLVLWICLAGSFCWSLTGCTRGGSKPVLEACPSQEAAEAAGERQEGEPAEAPGTEEDGSGKAADPVQLSTSGQEKTQDAVRAEQQDNGTVTQDLQPAREQPLLKAVTVHVCGAVCREGVYELPAGSRIRDAVEAAGGFAPDADSSWLNLAQVLEDAWQIRIPTREEADALRADLPPSMRYGAGPSAADGYSAENGRGSADPEKTISEAAPNGAAKVNLNTASKEELMTIPGIGESKAGRILEYRDRNGPFERIEDLMKVPGIKDASFQKIREYVTV